MKLLYKILGFGFVMYVAFFASALSIDRFRERKPSLDQEQKVKIMAVGSPVDISDISPLEVRISDDREAFFYDAQSKRRVAYLNNPITDFLFSPSRNKFGYLVNYSIYDENIPYDGTRVLRIAEVDSRKSKQVFRGSVRTAGWEWLSDEEILVSESCGTECQAQFLIDLKSAKTYILRYGVKYTWSPDKKLVFAYNYSLRHGITVGDKYGKKLFNYWVDWNNKNIGKSNTPQAMWSPDSSKLALVLEKPSEDGYELVIFDSYKNFKRSFQSDIDFVSSFKVDWSGDSKKALVNGKEFIIE